MTDVAEPERPTPETRVANARAMGKVIRCVTAEGTTLDHVYPDGILPGCWVAIREDVMVGKIVHRDAVESQIRECTPDVELIEESESLFRRGDGDGE